MTVDGVPPMHEAEQAYLVASMASMVHGVLSVWARREFVEPAEWVATLIDTLLADGLQKLVTRPLRGAALYGVDDLADRVDSQPASRTSRSEAVWTLLRIQRRPMIGCNEFGGLLPAHEDNGIDVPAEVECPGFPDQVRRLRGREFFRRCCLPRLESHRL